MGIDNFVMIPHYSLKVGAGPGRQAFAVEKIGELGFRRDWMEGKRINIEKAGIAEVVGDSMERRLFAGDLVLFDGADREIRSGRCYVVRIGEELVVKYLSRLPDNSIQATSENSAVAPPFMLPVGDEAGRVEIVGRVRASNHDWD